MTMGDRIAVLKDGDVLQVDTPAGLYENPANTFVATFIGSPKMNVLEAELTDQGLTMLGATVGLSPVQARALAETQSGRAIRVGLRPLDLRPPADIAGAEHTGRVRGVVDVVEHSGSEVFATVKVADTLVVSRFSRHVVPQAGDRVELAFSPAHLYFFDAETGARLIDRDAVLRDSDAGAQRSAVVLNEAQH
jgi:multiple sugar transport system ATP-binding protein